jgi:general secretion pathway protein D
MRWGMGLLAALWITASALINCQAQQQQQRNTRSTANRSSTTYYPSSTEVGGATVTYDPETRKLIVVSDDDTARHVSQVVSNLDRPAPQVLIKVVFLEVTYRKGLDLGVEGTYRNSFGDTNTMSILQSFAGLPGLSSGQGLFALAGNDYTVFLRAIAESGKLEVLSRPTILARNNQQATINVGQQVPLITNVRYDTFGNQINAISYQDVGIILRVTPFITSDSMVEMVVSPEISNLSDQSVPISTGTNTVGAPIINIRSADTVVVTPDNQTVVIGGLMQNTKTESVSKIPVLGDLPWIGAAFRRKVTGESKTELLIFLTPKIILYPNQLAAMTAAERANNQIVPQAFSQEELNRFFDTLPTREGSTIPAEPPPSPKP